MNTLYYDKEATKASFDIDIYLDALYLLRETPDIKREVQAQLNQNISAREDLRDDIDDYIDEMKINESANIDKGKAMEAFDSLTSEEIMNFVSIDEDDIDFNCANSAERVGKRCCVYRVTCTFDVKQFIYSIKCHKDKSDEPENELKNELEIRKVLGLSTAHLTESTRSRLDRDPDDNNLGLTVYPFAYGWFVYIKDFKEKDGEVLCLNIACNLPKDLNDCIILGIRNDCQWLQFDGDAPETDLLQIFEG